MRARPTPEADLLPASDRSLRVSFGDAVDIEASMRVVRLLRRLDAAPLDGVVDASPAYASVLVRFDPLRLDHESATAHVRRLLAGLDDEPLGEPRRVSIPARYGGADGPDLENLARDAGISPAEVVRLHASTTYRVHFLGFTPGFAYMGTVPQAIAAPRLERPRRSVPAGSIGIAGTQTGIYPCATPGGWRLIARIDLRLFDPDRRPMSLLEIGDEVRFVPEAGAPTGDRPVREAR
jgi:KipI family sensor histidine kinase inhibitor